MAGAAARRLPLPCRAFAILQIGNDPSWVGYQGSIAKSAPLLGVQPIPANVYAPADIDKVLDALTREPNLGLLVLPRIFHHGSSRQDRGFGRPSSLAGGVPVAVLCYRRRTDSLRGQHG